MTSVSHDTSYVPETSEIFWCYVKGTPRPQGSARAFVIGKRAVITSASKHLAGWRTQMTAEIVRVMRLKQFKKINGPVCVALEFFLERAKSNTKRRPAQKPDIDKLARAVLDACTDAGLWEDDSQVVILTAEKSWAVGEGVALPGVTIMVKPC